MACQLSISISFCPNLLTNTKFFYFKSFYFSAVALPLYTRKSHPILDQSTAPNVEVLFL